MQNEELIESHPMSMADLETHDKVLKMVQKHFVEPARFIDLGAGEGAFTEKLIRLGHEVVAVDASSGHWKLPNVRHIELDLNSEFAERLADEVGTFDAVIAIEIIEHLENPFNFTRQIAKLLKPGGLLFLTTPNVEAINSRLIFLYTGRLKHFGAYETVRPAHITPIFRWKMEMLLDEAGFEVMEERFNRVSYQTGTNFRSTIASMVGRLLDRLVKGPTGGECHIIAARRI